MIHTQPNVGAYFGAFITGLAVCGLLTSNASTVSSGATHESHSNGTQSLSLVLHDGATNLLDLLSQRVTIAECIAEVCNFSYSNSIPARSCVYVFLRWQTNAYFYREMPTLQDLVSTNVQRWFKLFGRYETNYWRLGDTTPGASILAMTQDGSSAVVYPIEKQFPVHASKVCNFGIFDCLPEMISFENLLMKPFTNVNGLRVTGEANSFEAGRVPSLAFEIHLQGRTIPWVIEYFYEQSDKLPRAAPGFLKAYTLGPSGKQLRHTVRYLSLQLTTSMLPESYFSVSNFMKHGMTTFTFIGNKGFYRDHAGKLRPGFTHDKKPYLRKVFVVLSVLLILVTGVRVWQTKRKEP